MSMIIPEKDRLFYSYSNFHSKIWNKCFLNFGMLLMMKCCSEVMFGFKLMAILCVLVFPFNSWYVFLMAQLNLRMVLKCQHTTKRRFEFSLFWIAAYSICGIYLKTCIFLCYNFFLYVFAYIKAPRVLGGRG